MFAFGSAIWARVRTKSIGLASCLGIAIGIEAGLLLALGLSNLFRSAWIILANIIALGFTLVWAKPRPSRLRLQFPKNRWVLVLAVFVILSVHATLLPRKGYDAYKYHLYYGKIIALNGGLPTWGDVYDHHWFFPQMYELIVASTWALDPDSYRPAYVFSAFVGIVCCLAVYDLTKALGGSSKAATLGALILFATPLFFTHTTNGYNDLLLGTFTVLGVLNLISGHYSLSGVFFGFGVWVKVFGLLNIVFLAVYTAIKRRPKVVKVLVIACILGSTFFVRNIIVFGDPISIYSEENAGLSLSSLVESFSANNVRDNLGWWFFDYAGNEDFISLTHRGIGVLLPIFSAYVLIFSKSRYRIILLVCTIWVVMSVIYCNLGGEGYPKQIARYAMPAIIPLCSLAGIGMFNFLDEGGGLKKRCRVILLSICLIYPSLAYATIPMLDSLSTTGSLMPSEETYFSKEYPDLVELSNRIGSDPYTVRIGWTGKEVWPFMEVPPYLLRQRRAEWPHMWVVGLAGMEPHMADFILLPGGINPPTHLDLTEVFISEDYQLFEVEYNDGG